ncbi:MAG: amino acid permease [Alphaproteobacteria bacterium]
MNLFRVKNLNSINEVASNSSLKRSLTAADILLLGIGAVIGTGVFVMTGVAAANYAGPAIVFSYLLAGVSAIFVALAYIEIASMVPAAGSIYTYTYISLGELAAWLVGWLILLEYTVSASTIAVGWSGYMVGVLKSGGINLPLSLTLAPSQGGIINLPATLISLFICALLVKGTKESVKLNNILVALKLGAIFVFILVAAPKVKISNWTDNFAPYGLGGIAAGAATIFFGYTGFDLLSTTTEECKNPRRDIIIGLIGSLIICTIIYMLVAAILTGIVPFSNLNNSEPLTYAMRQNGSNLGSALVATGAIAGMTTVLIVQMYAQSRLLFFMARDGMLPRIFSNIHTKYQTPYQSTKIIGIIISLISGFTPIDLAANLASTAMLFEYIIVAIIVLYLRKKMPTIVRPFKCPIVYIIAPLALILCSFLIYNLLSISSLVFVVWTVIGLAIYFMYSYKNSRLTNNIENESNFLQQ